MLERIKRVWPNAHPEWEMILRKSNGKEKVTKKDSQRYITKDDIKTSMSIVQKVKVQCKLHRVLELV